MGAHLRGADGSAEEDGSLHVQIRSVIEDRRLGENGGARYGTSKHASSGPTLAEAE